MRRILFPLLAVLLPLCSLAATPPALEAFQKRGGSVQQSFIGPDGLTGWVVSYQGKTFIVFTTASGDYAISGDLVDKDGHDLTSEYTRRYLPSPDLSKLVLALQQDPALVDEGDPKAPPLYVFADPNCFYCNHLWNDTRPFVRSGQLRIRWAMVSFLKQSSDGRATAILAAKDRLAAFTVDESGFDKAHEEGGIPPVSPMSEDVRDALMAHANEMAGAGGQGTPLLVFRSHGQWYTLEGLPTNLNAFVGALEQPGATSK